MSATVAKNLAAGAVEAAPRSFPAAAPANDQHTLSDGHRAPLEPVPAVLDQVGLARPLSTADWAHVGVLLVDRANRRATLYDVVSCGPRKAVRS